MNAVALQTARGRPLALTPWGAFGHGWLSISPLGAVTISLYATGTGSIADVVDETDATSSLHESIDDDPASPSDADWINNTDDAGHAFFDLTDMPSDFSSMTTLTITVRWRGYDIGATRVLRAQVFASDESTPLTDEELVATASASSSYVNTEITFSGVVGGNKATWDGARLRLRWAAS